MKKLFFYIMFATQIITFIAVIFIAINIAKSGCTGARISDEIATKISQMSNAEKAKKLTPADYAILKKSLDKEFK